MKATEASRLDGGQFVNKTPTAMEPATRHLVQSICQRAEEDATGDRNIHTSLILSHDSPIISGIFALQKIRDSTQQPLSNF